ncbi:MAG TPA: DUF3426 domain-containing protein [Steroidobacteraceae bacterium]|nr:DUF3426 domain-containing protein [Steroidobacteraceae bacterium]
MFTVCPKCALTLVVTAADLRVAQGYVRCGRCSNVFNALARLSEDREAAAAAAQNQAAAQREPAQSPPPAPARPETDQPAPQKRPATVSDAGSTSSMRQPGLETLSSASSVRLQQLADAPPDPIPPSPTSATPAPPSPAPEKSGAAEDDIPDDALEFNPEATDVTKVFVEQAPSPEFQAATGTFQAIRLEAEEARVQEQRAREAERSDSSTAHLGPVDTQVDVEIDPELLATMAQLGSPSAPPPDSAAPHRRHAGEESTSTSPVAKPQGPLAPAALRTAAGPSSAPRPAASAPRPRNPSGVSALTGAKPTSSPQPAAAPGSAPPAVDSSQGGLPTPLAARARARVEAARPSLETAQAIRSMLVRKRPQVLEVSEEAEESAGGVSHERLWIAASAVMALLLVTQVVHHYRNDLAANTHLNRPLTALYSALGMHLVPRWNLGAYEVRQLGASTAPDAPGQITVRASVKNDADQSQPMPLLRVTLQDRFGNRIAARDVPPRAYLPGAAHGGTFLSAGQRVDAEMAFVDPGANAVGFEIDACLPAPGGVIACANDALSR